MTNESVALISTSPLQEGNSPVQLTAVQEFLLPYLPYLESAWWMVFFCALLYLSFEYVVKPLWQRWSVSHH